jgi:D-alanyl-D-alanine carboxypeptidase
LLYGVLLSSANDASVVLAEGIGGSVEKFAEMMTKKAHAIGASNTHFTNPHGLTAPDHYSTARDLALIFRYAMKNPAFRKIVHTKISSVKSLTPGKKRTKARLISVRNHNRLLWNYDGALGGKTGYTLAAQKCFVGAVERNGVTLIVSLLGSRNLWGDTKRLLEYGFDNYHVLNTPMHVASRSAREERSLPHPAKASVIVTPDEESLTNASNNGYVLQVGSFRERHRAESLLHAFSEKGFEVFVEKTEINDRGEISYRVRLGPFAQLVEAQEMVEEVLDRSGHHAIILPVSMMPDAERAGNQAQPRL